MDKEAIIARLRASEADLCAHGVAHAALFGARAGGDHRPDSDADIMIEIDPELRVSAFDYAGIKLFISDLFDRSIDVVDRRRLYAGVALSAAPDVIHAF